MLNQKRAKRTAQMEEKTEDLVDIGQRYQKIPACPARAKGEPPEALKFQRASPHCRDGTQESRESSATTLAPSTG
jgi:hypothetical protein